MCLSKYRSVLDEIYEPDTDVHNEFVIKVKQGIHTRTYHIQYGTVALVFVHDLCIATVGPILLPVDSGTRVPV